MKKLKEILTKPRGIYFSIVAMLTVTILLAKISFSFYVSTNEVELPIKPINNQLTIEGYDSNKIEINPHESEYLTLKIKSTYETKTKYYVSYQSNESLILNIVENDDDTIDSNGQETIVVRLENTSDEIQSIEFEIVSGFLNAELETTGNIINEVE